MENVQRALTEVQDLYQQVTGQPAPEVVPDSFLPFPPGVDPIHHALEEVAQLKLWSKQAATAPIPTAWTPPADVYARPEGLTIHLDIPGVDRESLKVFLASGECVVRGERKPVAREMRPLAIERPWGFFERRFVLPSQDQSGPVTARYRDGILELQIARGEAATAGELTVEVE